MNKFEAGCKYRRTDGHVIEVTKRTENSIWIGAIRLKVRTAETGEYVKFCGTETKAFAVDKEA